MGFEFWQGSKICLFSKMSRLVLGSIWPSIRWVLCLFPGDIDAGEKWGERIFSNRQLEVIVYIRIVIMMVLEK